MAFLRRLLVNLPSCALSAAKVQAHCRKLLSLSAVGFDNSRALHVSRNNGISEKKLCGGNSAVECQLPKLDVAGSIPVPRSIFSIT
jgi:hypothetical protein